MGVRSVLRADMICEMQLIAITKKSFKSGSSTQKIQSQLLNYWEARLGYVRLTEVTQDLLYDEQQVLLEAPVLRKGQPPSKRGPAAVNRYLALLRHAPSLTYAYANGSGVSKILWPAWIC